ncbi:MAG TPA: restriction endonuclease, partial [Candidatus Marinimicrobia bacterium]|nr:restriction endonuclease [Candidatus Neomarinimicrobiota bacterium]
GSQTYKLSEWNPFADEAASWFDPEWMFGVTEGFDVVIGNPPYVQLQKDGGKLANMYKNCNYQTFGRTGDIYALFYENGIKNLKAGGHLSFITSNKWMRAGYGRSLRRFFAGQNPLLLIDLGPGVFEHATVDTNILLIQKANHQGQLCGITLNEEAKGRDLADFINENKNLLPNLGEDTWFIGSEAEQRLKEKIEKMGKPLKDWDVNIYRGVLTGLNEAFIIDTPTKERLCKEDPKSAEILKPILRGRDIKRYGYEWAGLWIIFIPWHFPLHKDSTIEGASKKAEFEFQIQYPAIYRHLLKFKESLSRRNSAETGIRYEWYALQRCAATYYPEFEKEKVVWKEMSQMPAFSYDNNQMFCNDTGRLLTGRNIKFFIGLFNSVFFAYSFSNWHAGGALGDKGIRFKSEFMSDYPIPPITPSNKGVVEQIESKVEEIIAAKKQNSPANTTSLENQIDQMVYQLYNLTPEEITIVEGGE